MTQRNSIGRMLVARFDRLLGTSSGGPATVGIVLFALGVVGLMDEAFAAAVYAGAFTLGGLLAGARADKRSSSGPTRCPLELTRVHGHPVDKVDRNRR